MSVHNLNWTRLDTEITSALQVKRQHVSNLCRQFIEDGDVLVFGEDKR
jgi:hypothetical protein